MRFQTDAERHSHYISQFILKNYDESFLVYIDQMDRFILEDDITERIGYDLTSILIEEYDIHRIGHLVQSSPDQLRADPPGLSSDNITLIESALEELNLNFGLVPHAWIEYRKTVPRHFQFCLEHARRAAKGSFFERAALTLN